MCKYRLNSFEHAFRKIEKCLRFDARFRDGYIAIADGVHLIPFMTATTLVQHYYLKKKKWCA